jgi:ankyrin repeat protein
MTPLMTALLMRHKEVAAAVADAGADLRVRNHAGISIIWCAASANHAVILHRARACGEKLNYVTEAFLRLSGLRVKLLRKMLSFGPGIWECTKLGLAALS